MAVSTISAPMETIYDISGNSSQTFTVPNNYRGLMILTGSTNDLCGLYIIRSLPTGGVGLKAVEAASQATMDVSTANQLTVSNTTTYSLRIMIINIQNRITV